MSRLTRLNAAVGTIDASNAFTPRTTVGLAGFSAALTGTPLCIGADKVTGRIFYVGSTYLQWSDDAGATKSANKSLPAAITDVTSVAYLVRFAGYYWLGGYDATASRYKIYRSTIPTSGDFGWAEVLTLTQGSGGIGTSMDCDDKYLYVGEYADPSGLTPKLWAITLADAAGAGTNWVTKWTGASTRHIHTIACDPYLPGHLWLAGGDGQGFEILRSTDYGATWLTVATDANSQVVQISFTPDYVYGACDTADVTAWVWDKASWTKRSAAKNWHYNIPVPGGLGSRYLTDVTLVAPSTLQSPTGNFTSNDIGRRVLDEARYTTAGRVRTGAYIKTVNSATEVVLTAPVNAAHASTGASKVTVMGDRWYHGAFYGIVDPATGIYYCVAHDTSNYGNKYGLFYCPRPGDDLRLLTSEVYGGQCMRIAGGYLHSHQWRVPLLSQSAV
ncbi:hypothetical protein [Gordonia sp. N1V]|uniref:hypothetical protein n=1 Tax=Gordonia sp. N1V TaxID=3034163 RepID=UPI0023E23CEB|nr:hypothetical protein [Gordonia sp. N1V]MDF3280502.1 hypothetical protein [Gordonia sp. N1V]